MEDILIYALLGGGLWMAWKVRKWVWFLLLFGVGFLLIRGLQLSWPEVTVYMGILAATIAAWKFARWLS